MTEVNTKLLADLARLASKYPPEDWESLLRILDDPDERRRLSALLHELAATSASRQQRVHPATSSTGSQDVAAVIEDIRKMDPGRAELLDKVWAGLRNRELAQTMPALRALAEGAGLKGSLSRRRETAIVELMGYFVALPVPGLREAARLSLDRQLGSSGDYQSWVALILDREADTA